jgi:hypothetical protein
MMREGTGEGLTEADVLAVFWACARGELPAIATDSFIAALSHASALLRQNIPTVGAA